ncbi:hypothetical protein [Streptomyces sp. NPDC056244]|uniref:hypothetical protein n=1 Tax=unclassified Streptomyces TaxID=2593676 RepID=UPI0035DF0466
MTVTPLPTDRPPSFPEIMDDLAKAWCHTPWAASEMSFDGDAYHGVFDVDMAADVRAEAPYRPLLHGSVLAQIVSYHALASVLFAYTNQHHPVLAALPRVDLVEARRRFLVTALELSLLKPVFETRVPLKLTIDTFTDKWETHRMAFGVMSVEVAGGKHTARLEGCVNFRDAVDL